MSMCYICKQQVKGTSEKERKDDIKKSNLAFYNHVNECSKKKDEREAKEALSPEAIKAKAKKELEALERQYKGAMRGITNFYNQHNR